MLRPPTFLVNAKRAPRRRLRLRILPFVAVDTRQRRERGGDDRMIASPCFLVEGETTPVLRLGVGEPALIPEIAAEELHVERARRIVARQELLVDGHGLAHERLRLDIAPLLAPQPRELSQTDPHVRDPRRREEIVELRARLPSELGPRHGARFDETERFLDVVDTAEAPADLEGALVQPLRLRVASERVVELRLPRHDQRRRHAVGAERALHDHARPRVRGLRVDVPAGFVMEIPEGQDAVAARGMIRR